MENFAGLRISTFYLPKRFPLKLFTLNFLFIPSASEGQNVISFAGCLWARGGLQIGVLESPLRVASQPFAATVGDSQAGYDRRLKAR